MRAQSRKFGHNSVKQNSNAAKFALKLVFSLNRNESGFQSVDTTVIKNETTMHNSGGFNHRKICNL